MIKKLFHYETHTYGRMASNYGVAPATPVLPSSKDANTKYVKNLYKCIRKKNCASSWLFTRTEPKCTVNKIWKKKSLQFLPYGRGIGSWICLTHKTYTCHTVQNTYSASMAVSDSQSIFHFNLRCLSYSALFRFLSRMRCTSMGVWGSMIY
jgi:hypothetical protein